MRQSRAAAGVLLHGAFQHRGELGVGILRMALSQASATAP